MQLIDFFTRTLEITEPRLLDLLVPAARLETLDRGQLLLSVGETQRNVNFLISGIIRGFLIDENGHELTDGFIFQPGEAAVGNYDFPQPAKISLEAITDCRLLTVPVDLVMKIIDEPQIIRIYKQQLLCALERNWGVKILLYQCTAMQRYLWFLEHYPNLEDSISGKHLASYLSMTPVTLSRLRRSLRDSNLPPPHPDV